MCILQMESILNTNEDEAKLALKDLNEYTLAKYPASYKSVANWKVSYNHTHGIGIDLYMEHGVEDRHHKVILHIVSKIYEKKKKTKFLL